MNTYILCNITIYRIPSCQKSKYGVFLIKRTYVRFLERWVQMTEQQQRMKELLKQADTEITDQILSDVLAKYDIRLAEAGHLDPAQGAHPSIPKS